MSYESTEVHLVRRPNGWPVDEDFTLSRRTLPTPSDDQLIVTNKFISVDPYMRGRMNDVKSYVPPFALNNPMEGGAVGVVEASASERYPVGAHVLHNRGWRDVAMVDASEAQAVDPTVSSGLSSYLGALGMPGLTAYVGLFDIAAMKPGDTVFVSGAAGAVGQLVGQMARLRGAKRVIGSAGSEYKIDFLTRRLGFDAAFNYHDGPPHDSLAAAAPDGINVYFDNVGGDHLEAAIDAMKPHGRAAICGAIAQYNSTEPPAAPRNLAMLIGKRLKLQGFLVPDHYHRMPDCVADVGTWLEEGDLISDETIVDGIDNAAEAFVGMLRGENLGKMLVRV